MKNKKLISYIMIMTIVLPLLLLPSEMTAECGFDSFRTLKANFLRVAVAGVLIWLLPSIWLSLFYAFVLWSSMYFYAQDSKDAFFYITLMLSFYCLIYYKWDYKYNMTLRNGIRIVHILMCVAVVLQYQFFMEFNKPGFAVTGTFSGQNILASFLAFSGVFFWQKKWISFVPLTITCLLMADTKTAMIAYAVTAALYMTRFIKKRYWIIAPVLISIAIWMTPDLRRQIKIRGALDRVVLWNDMFKYQFKEARKTSFQGIKFQSETRPLTGYGPGMFETHSLVHHLGFSFRNPDYFREAHNDWAQGFMQFGIIGMFPLMIFFWLEAYFAIRRRDLFSMAIICLMINACGHFVMQTVVAYYVVLLLAVNQSRLERWFWLENLVEKIFSGCRSYPNIVQGEIEEISDIKFDGKPYPGEDI